MPERLFSTYQIADLLGATPSTVMGWIEKGWLPCKRLPNGPLRISEKHLIRFLKQQGVDIEAVMAKAVLREGKTTSVLEEPTPEPQGPPTEPEIRILEPTPVPPPADSTDLPHPEPVDVVESPRQLEDPETQVTEAIIGDAVTRRASHIHLEPGPSGLSLRLRIDGVLHDKVNFRLRLPRTLGPKLIAKLKSMAGADETETRLPQTGCFRQTFAGREVEFRLTTCPTLHGEKVVIHILDREQVLLDLSQIGLSEQDQQQMRTLLDEPSGLIVVGGPPRSGKSTTLRAMTAELTARGRNVVMAERSAELTLEGVSQSQTDPGIGFTFTEAMRTFAQLDPDVIVLGDVPDPQTAAGALDAALEGRLVLAAMRARSAPEVVAELLQMRLEPWSLASVLLGVIAQRTVRKIHQQCKQQVTPSEEVLQSLSLQRADVDFAVFRGSGCKACSNCGYVGKTGVFSSLPMVSPVISAIRNRQDVSAIQAAAQQEGMKTLRQAALEKVRAGETSLDEVAPLFPQRRKFM